MLGTSPARIVTAPHFTLNSPRQKEPAMKPTLLLTVLAFLFAVSAVGLADPSEVMIDGSPAMMQSVDLPAKTEQGADGRTIDVVGDASNSASDYGLAKGNAYRVDVNVTLDEAEFWLNFTSTQVLTYYVFVSPVEFGTYTEIYRDTEVVSGTGAGWYSTGSILISLSAGNHYIIAVSWDGFMTYYFGAGDSQDTSFGAHVHGHATGENPLPASFDSLVNDYAIYYQRLNTTATSPVEESTWGGIKALYR